jgi:NAD(P)-dependent dehydrogenase (short-subunit alcohol dehydrogenase family)
MAGMLVDRVAIITGAGNGLGRAHALAMAAEGAAVVVNDIGTSPGGRGTSSGPADAVVAEIVRAGGKAVANYDSVATEAGAAALVRCALDAFGRLDILVNNAGIIRTGPVYDFSPEDWDAMLKTHLYGTFYCTREATRVMKERGYGRIINTSSHNGLGMATGAAYAAAKEGITGFTRSVARDMGKFGVTCNVIRPIAAWRGAVVKLEQFEDKDPRAVAYLVAYLASEAADNVNGCIFEVYNGHIGIYVEPPPVKQVIWKDGFWTPRELAEVMPQTLTRGQTRENLPQTLPFSLERQPGPPAD